MSKNIKLSPKHGLNPTIPVCFWCGKEKNEIALMGKINKKDSKAPRRIITDYNPCNECKELFEKGIHVIGVVEEPVKEGMFPIISDGKVKLYPTGATFLATEDWAIRFLTANGHEEMIENVLEKKKIVLPNDFVVKAVKEFKAQKETDLTEEVDSNENN